jgi:hypothetical protein
MYFCTSCMPPLHQQGERPVVALLIIFQRVMHQKQGLGAFPVAPASHPPAHQVPYEDEGSYVVVRHAALMTATLLAKVLKVSGWPAGTGRGR